MNIPDYTVRGPYGVRRLPKLEHTCVSCFPRCVGDACLLSIDAYVPSAPPPLPDNMFPLIGVDREGEDRTADSRGVTRGPFPLAVLTSGFLVDAEQYASLRPQTLFLGVRRPAVQQARERRRRRR